MEIKGAIIQILPPQSGMGKKGVWKKQEYVLQTKAQYPKKVTFTLWGDAIDKFNLEEMDEVTVAVDVESREYNGRWYTELRGWKIMHNEGAINANNPNTAHQNTDTSTSPTDDLPF